MIDAEFAPPPRRTRGEYARVLMGAALAGTALLGVALAGCAPTDAEPTPTPTAFASEEEAFAAAEATYRAYVDALNQVDLADPATFEEVYRWTTGDANAEARESFSQMHADGWIVSGDSRVASFLSDNSIAPEDLDSASAYACLEVASVTLTDSAGTSVVDPGRPAVQSMRVVVVAAPTATGGTILTLEGADQSVCD